MIIIGMFRYRLRNLQSPNSTDVTTTKINVTGDVIQRLSIFIVRSLQQLYNQFETSLQLFYSTYIHFQLQINLHLSYIHFQFHNILHLFYMHFIILHLYIFYIILFLLLHFTTLIPFYIFTSFTSTLFLLLSPKIHISFDSLYFNGRKRS